MTGLRCTMSMCAEIPEAGAADAAMSFDAPVGG
jgi:hypothetical protein